MPRKKRKLLWILDCKCSTWNTTNKFNVCVVVCKIDDDARDDYIGESELYSSKELKGREVSVVPRMGRSEVRMYNDVKKSKD